MVLDMVLRCALEFGARLAEPGEFSKRAYLNNKFDLSQAEAIIDLINSKTEQAATSAMRSLQGHFSFIVKELIEELIKVRVYVEAAIDFPEEEIDYFSDDKLNIQIKKLQARLESVLSEAETGALLTGGAVLVLLGKPNAGKSSLMNRFTGKDTSIITDIPGTTRDIVEGHLHIDGIPLSVFDTAGIRVSSDAIESEGVRRAIKVTEEADLALLIVDASVDNPESDLIDLISLTEIEKITIYNKIDLVEKIDLPEQVLGVSTRTGEGLEDLKALIKCRLGVESGFESTYTARTRHILALKKAHNALERGVFQLDGHKAGELLSEELRLCQLYLSEITGDFTADDLLGKIFENFCIGK